MATIGPYLPETGDAEFEALIERFGGRSLWWGCAISAAEGGRLRGTQEESAARYNRELLRQAHRRAIPQNLAPRYRQPMVPRRVLLLLLLLALTSVAGVWVGERIALTWIPLPAAVPAFLAVTAVATSWRFHRGVALAAGATCLTLFVTGYFMGSQEVGLVFTDCLHEGERVRQRLERHRQETGSFPDRLDELGPGLPGRLLLSPPLLRYRRTPTGYELKFRDALVTHRATESAKFLATK